MEIEELIKVVSRNISQIRVAKGKSQTEIALESSVPQSQYSRIENGKVEPSLATLIKLANTFEVPLSDFFRAESHEEMALSDKLKAVMKMHKENKQWVETAIDLMLLKMKTVEHYDSLKNQIQ